MIALHDDPTEAYIEVLAPGSAVLHADVTCDVEAYLAGDSELDEEQKAAILALWFDPAISRSYQRKSGYVLISARA